MDKIKMTLISNGNKALEGESNFRLINNKYIFRIDNSNYIVDVDNKTFTKNDSDTSILIDIKNKLMSVKLVNHPGSIDLELTKYSFIQEGNEIHIDYQYNLEEDMNNNITILIG